MYSIEELSWRNLFQNNSHSHLLFNTLTVYNNAMIQLSHPSKLWVFLILFLYFMVIGITGTVLIVPGITLIKMSCLLLLIAGMVILLKPRQLLQTQEILLSEGFIYLPLSDEKIPFDEINRIKRAPFQAFYTIEMKHRKPL